MKADRMKTPFSDHIIYTILHATKAALILGGISVESHSAARRLFGRHFIKTGRFDVKYAKILNTEQDMRYRADYDSMYVAHEQDAKECVNDAEDFLHAIEHYLKAEGVDMTGD